MKNLEQLRTEIDFIDSQIVQLFNKRLQIVDEIANVKTQLNRSVLDSKREQIVFANAVNISPRENVTEVTELMQTIMNISKNRQLKK